MPTTDHSKPIATKTFTANLILEGSWGERTLGAHESTMELYDTDKAGYGYIEWEVPALDRNESIGLWYEMRDGKRALTDYDGTFSLPTEAVALLEEFGVIVDAEFKA